MYRLKEVTRLRYSEISKARVMSALLEQDTMPAYTLSEDAEAAKEEGVRLGEIRAALSDITIKLKIDPNMATC